MKTINKKIVPLEDCYEWEENPRDIKPEALESLKNGIEELGMYKPLLATEKFVVGQDRPQYEVIGGNMRLRALKEMGRQQVWVHLVEPKDDAEKFRLAMQDNDQVGEWDEQGLAEMLQSMPAMPSSELFITSGSPTGLDFLKDQFTKPEPTREKDENTLKDSHQTYLDNPVKQVVLYFFPNEYNAVVEKLDRIGKTLGGSSDSEAVIKLLDYYDENGKAQGDSNF